jgi:hypothetical protein
LASSRSWRRALTQYPAALSNIAEPEPSLVDLDHFLVQRGGWVFLFDYGLPHAIARATPKSEFG